MPFPAGHIDDAQRATAAPGTARHAGIGRFAPSLARALSGRSKTLVPQARGCQ